MNKQGSPRQSLWLVHCSVLLVSALILVAESKPTIRESSKPPSQNQQFQSITKPIGQYKFTRYMEPHLELHKIPQDASSTSSNTNQLNNITCNDGSPIGYYKRLNNHSKSWVIYLQGGGYCFSEESCQFRWQRTPELMSSNWWPKSKQVDGILSSELKDNPYLWNANHIYIPYCSSDSWTGLAPSVVLSHKPGSGSGSFSNSVPSGQHAVNSFVFMGSKILERVLESLYEDLPRESSLHEAKFILLAGDSAGATGVIQNLDRVSEFVQRKASLDETTDGPTPSDYNATKQAPTVRGLADSGWFLDNEPYDISKGELYQSNRPNFDLTSTMADSPDTDCDKGRCTPLQSIKLAMRFWNGQVPESCRQQHPSDPWRCYFGYRAYQTLKTPLFVVQWIYDEAQLLIDNIIRPESPDQWNYITRLANDIRASFENVTALFAPSCFSHSLIIKRSWNQININGFKLPHLLNSWEEQSLLETNSSTLSTAITNTDKATNYASSNLNPHSSFEALPMSKSSSQQVNVATQDMLRQPYGHNVRPDTQPVGQRTSQPGNNSRLRPRKRKRNNQQQRQKQARLKQQASTTESSNQQPLSLDTSFNSQPNDLPISNNPMQELMSLVDRSLISSDILFSNPITRDGSNGRASRSTIVDDSTIMLTNNVPDETDFLQLSSNSNGRNSMLLWPIGLDTLASDTTSQVASMPMRIRASDRFRLIDSCGWPQCNRDCPNFEPDFSFASLT